MFLTEIAKKVSVGSSVVLAAPSLKVIEAED